MSRIFIRWASSWTFSKVKLVYSYILLDFSKKEKMVYAEKPYKNLPGNLGNIPQTGDASDKISIRTICGMVRTGQNAENDAGFLFIVPH